MTCDRNMCYQQEYNDGGCNTCPCDDKQSMTNQEIIEQLESLKCHCEDFKDDEECVWDKDVEALDWAIEALEKQIPKKPVPNIEYYDNGDCCWHRTCCPNCKTPMDSFNKLKHCDNCGQAIDWGDEE